ncbi:MAG: formimidoylglutamase [Bacteroidota bacterium]|nr:formimidoylglutamase [Bacteroidota bacterium]
MELWKFLTEPSPELFFSRNDESDPRMGDLVLHKRKNLSDDVRVGIIGVPDDTGVKRNLGRPGAKDAPDEIRKAFYKLTPFSLSKGRPLAAEKKQISDLSIVDFGNVKTGASLEQTHERLEAAVSELLSRSIFPIVLGGGHDIAYPVFAALSRTTKSAPTGSSTSVINIDAHLDVRRPNPRRNSGTSFRQMLDHPHRPLMPMHLVEIGIQPFVNAREHYHWLLEKGATIFSLQEMKKEGIVKILDLAYEIAANSTDALYMSFDMDAVRSADAPGVSAPNPSGLSPEEIFLAAEFAGRRHKTKVVDIVEVNPRHDADGRTCRLAALAIMHVLLGFTNR